MSNERRERIKQAALRDDFSKVHRDVWLEFSALWAREKLLDDVVEAVNRKSGTPYMSWEDWRPIHNAIDDLDAHDKEQG